MACATAEHAGHERKAALDGAMGRRNEPLSSAAAGRVRGGAWWRTIRGRSSWELVVVAAKRVQRAKHDDGVQGAPLRHARTTAGRGVRLMRKRGRNRPLEERGEGAERVSGTR